jgi:hypothetical protein
VKRLRQQLPHIEAQADFMAPDGTRRAVRFDDTRVRDARVRVARDVDDAAARQGKVVRHGSNLARRHDNAESEASRVCKSRDCLCNHGWVNSYQVAKTGRSRVAPRQACVWPRTFRFRHGRRLSIQDTLRPDCASPAQSPNSFCNEDLNRGPEPRTSQSVCCSNAIAGGRWSYAASGDELSARGTSCGG